MKFIHFADLHLGIENYGTVDPDTGLSSRLADVLRVLDELVDYALGNNIDFVLFCGDAYKTREPSQTQQRELAKRVKRMSDAGMPLFMVVGNHDLPNAPGRANALEIFQTLSVSKVLVSSKPAVHRIDTRTGPVQIAALPWLRRSGLLAKEESRSLTLEQITSRMQQTLTDTVSFLAGSTDPTVPAVLAAHVAVGSARLGSERTMMLGKEPVVLTSNMALPQFDYVALGHIHKAQVLHEHPPVVYSGSMERIDFGEESDDKGFYVVELNTTMPAGERCVAKTFHTVSAKKFITVHAKIEATTPNPTAEVLRSLAERETEFKNAVVRIEVDCPEQLEGQLLDADIRRAVKDAQSVNISKNIERETRVRLSGQNAEDLTARRVLELYLDTVDPKKLSAERKKLLLEYGERLIWEREAGGAGAG